MKNWWHKFYWEKSQEAHTLSQTSWFMTWGIICGMVLGGVRFAFLLFWMWALLGFISSWHRKNKKVK